MPGRPWERNVLTAAPPSFTLSDRFTNLRPRTRRKRYNPSFFSSSIYPSPPPPPWVSRCASRKTLSLMIRTLSSLSLSQSHPSPNPSEKSKGRSSPPPAWFPSSSSHPTLPSSTGRLMGSEQISSRFLSNPRMLSSNPLPM